MAYYDLMTRTTLGHPFQKRRRLGRAAQGFAGGAPAVMRLARYLRAGRVLALALGGPFYVEPENLDPPLGYSDEFGAVYARNEEPRGGYGPVQVGTPLILGSWERWYQPRGPSIATCRERRSGGRAVSEIYLRRTDLRSCYSGP